MCRNTLMYFNQEAQSRIVARFHFALRPGGHLVLGRAEMLLNFTDMFQPVDPLHRRDAASCAAGRTAAFPAGPRNRVRRSQRTDTRGVVVMQELDPSTSGFKQTHVM